MESPSLVFLLLAPCWASQPDDVQFTNIKCDPDDPLRYHAIPNDDSNYWQCGPGGFYWTLPCAPGSKFSQEHQACVWQGDGPIPSDLHQPHIPATPAHSRQPGQDLREAAGVDQWRQIVSSVQNNASGVQIPWYLKENENRISRTPLGANPWYVSTPYRGESVFSPILDNGQAKSQPDFNSRGNQEKRQPSSTQERVTPPANPVIIPFLAVPPPGPATAPPNFEDAWAEWPPFSPADAFGAPQAQAQTSGQPRPGQQSLPHPNQQGPPPGFFQPPPGRSPHPMPIRPPHVPDEPVPPVRLFKGCIEDDTCPFGETTMEIYCYYEGDDTKYYQCSPHSDHGGLWVIRRCPGGLVFVGDRCDRPQRISTNPNQVELKASELEYEYVEYEEEYDVEPGQNVTDYEYFQGRGGEPQLATFILPPDSGSPAKTAEKTSNRVTPSRPLSATNTGRSQQSNSQPLPISRGQGANSSLKETQTKLDVQRQQLSSQQAELKRQQELLARQIENQHRERERLIAQQKAQAQAAAVAQKRARLQAAQKAEHFKRLQELKAQREAQARAAELQRKQEVELKALEEQKKKLHAQRMQLLAQQRQAQSQAKQLSLLRQQQVQQQQQSYVNYQNLFGSKPQPASFQKFPEQNPSLFGGSLTQGQVLIPPNAGASQNQPGLAGIWNGANRLPPKPRPVLQPGQQASRIFPPFFSNNHQTALGSHTSGAVQSVSNVQRSQFPLRTGGSQPQIAGSVPFQHFQGLKRSSPVGGERSGERRSLDVSLEAQPCSVLSPPKTQLLSGPLEDGGKTFFMCIAGAERSRGVWAKLRCPKDSTFNSEKQICL